MGSDEEFRDVPKGVELGYIFTSLRLSARFISHKDITWPDVTTHGR